MFAPSTVVDYSEGNVVSREILRNNAGTLTLFAFDAGQGLSEHTAPFDATVTILDGEAEITIGGVVHHPSRRNAHHACWRASCPPSCAAFQDASHHDSWLSISLVSHFLMCIAITVCR